MAVVSDLVQLYADVGLRLTHALQRVRKDGGVLTVQNRPYVEQQLGRIMRDMRRIDALTKRLGREMVTPEFEQASDRALATLKRAGLPIAQTQRSSLEVQTLAHLDARLSTDLRAIRATVGEALALGDPIRKGPLAVEAALREDGLVTMRRGEAAIKTPSGKYWKPDAYARMLTRTAVADVRREAFRTRYLANGVDLVQVIANGTKHAICRVWEGEVLSLTGSTPGYPTVDEARAAGLFHPNCRHRYVVATGEDVEQPPVPSRAFRVVPTAARSVLGRRPPRTPLPSAPRTPRTPAPTVRR